LINFKSLINPPIGIKNVGNLIVILKPLQKDNPSESDGWNGVK